MTVPAGLEQAKKRAQEAMLDDPDHILRPFYRQTIYQAIDSLAAEKAGAVRGWLAVLTAEFVLPVWRQQWPDNPIPEHMTRTARAVLLGEGKPQLAMAEAQRAWHRLTNLGGRPEAVGHSRPVSACAAAVEALFEALGGRPFDSLDINESTRNGDLDPGTTDTAYYASRAYAGREVWAPFAADEKGPPPSPEKRREFWQWWLKEAIPTAWRMAHQPDPGG